MKIQPKRRLAELFEESNFDFLPQPFGNVNRFGLMRTDIREDDKKFIFDVEIPGIEKKDLKIKIEGDYLHIDYLKQEETQEEEENYVRRERRLSSCSRIFFVGQINEEKTVAKYSDGILTIVVPKLTKAEEEAKYIEIK